MHVCVITPPGTPPGMLPIGPPGGGVVVTFAAGAAGAAGAGATGAADGVIICPWCIPPTMFDNILLFNFLFIFFMTISLVKYETIINQQI